MVFYGIFLRLFRLYTMNGATNEQDHFMATESADRRSQIHAASETHGRRGVFLGRAVEVCLHQPRSWPLHKTGNSVSALHRDLRWRLGNYWRAAVARGLYDKSDCNPVCHRDDCGDSLDEDFLVSGNLAFASAASAAPSWILGCVARNPIRVCADADGDISNGERAREVVAGRSAG